MRKRGTPAHADEFGVSAELPRIDTEDAVTDAELSDGSAHCFDLPGELAAENSFPRSEDPSEESGDKRPGPAELAVGAGDRRCVHPDQHFAILRAGPFNLLQS